MLNINQRFIIITIIAAFVVGGTIYLYERDKGKLVDHTKVFSNRKTKFPIDLNNVSVRDLTAVPGIGVVKARAIVEYREKIGGFSSLSQLKCVKGIGEKTVEKITKYIKIDKPNLSGKIVTFATHTDKIDINTAGIDELMRIKYIGPQKAKEIIEYRKENGPFKSIRDVMKVKGIGSKTFDKIKMYIEVY
ncbi:MAG: ComEA family DNA-binding protein [Thermotogae bacterium]|nr:ComEA family DNA-binding protein [Thermotogota bacterium]